MYMLMENDTVNTLSIVEPKIYLGTDIIKVDYANGSCARTMSYDTYLKEDIMNVKKCMKDEKI